MGLAHQKDAGNQHTKRVPAKTVGVPGGSTLLSSAVFRTPGEACSCRAAPSRYHVRCWRSPAPWHRGIGIFSDSAGQLSPRSFSVAATVVLLFLKRGLLESMAL